MALEKHEKSSGQECTDGIRPAQAAPVVFTLPPEALRLTDHQRKLMEDLYDWLERSQKSNWVLGEPMGVRL